MITIRLDSVEIYDEAVIAAIESAEILGLKIIGFETRAEAMRSIVPGISRAGQPPRDKTGVFRRNINYAVEGKTVAVGPRLLPRRSSDVTPALEHGGFSFDVKGVRRYIKKRPVMAPVLNRIARRLLPSVFADSVKP